jgi:hypothetical protein
LSNNSANQHLTIFEGICLWATGKAGFILSDLRNHIFFGEKVFSWVREKMPQIAVVVSLGLVFGVPLEILFIVQNGVQLAFVIYVFVVHDFSAEVANLVKFF